jgi:hypothetical protein
MIKIIRTMRLEYKRDTVRDSMEGVGEIETVLGDEEYQNMSIMYVQKEHKEICQILFLKVGEGAGAIREYTRGKNLLKIHYMHTWNFHMKPPCIINES